MVEKYLAGFESHACFKSPGSKVQVGTLGNKKAKHGHSANIWWCFDSLQIAAQNQPYPKQPLVSTGLAQGRRCLQRNQPQAASKQLMISEFYVEFRRVKTWSFSERTLGRSVKPSLNESEKCRWSIECIHVLTYEYLALRTRNLTGAFQFDHNEVQEYG